MDLSRRAVYNPKAARALKPGGAIALFRNEHVHSDAGGFFEAAQAVYEREARDLRRELRRPCPAQRRAGQGGRDESSGLFSPVVRRSYLWDQAYDAVGYLRVLDNYSGHMSLGDETRPRLYAGIAHLIKEEYGGRIVKGYQTSLYVARKK